MNSLEEFLDAIGISNDTSVQEVANALANTAIASVPEPPQEPVSLSQEDVDEFLAENGFHEVHNAEAEEVLEEETVEEEDEDSHAESSSPTSSMEFNPEDVASSDFSVAVSAGSIEEFPPEPASSSQLPENSPTLLLDESTSRFSGAEWYEKIKNSRIILAGLGGIGSWCALQLARMTPASIVLYDDDVIEMANMSGQFYGSSDVGNYKVDAVIDSLHRYTNISNVYGVRERFTSSTEAGNIMMCGFDNMSARSVFFQSWRNHVQSLSEEERAECLFLDGRLSIDCLQVFAIRGSDAYNMKRYEEKFLFDDSQAEATVCSMKQTTYLACMISSFMVNLFTNFIAETLNPVLPYALPFFTEYDAQNMLFKAEN